MSVITKCPLCESPFHLDDDSTFDGGADLTREQEVARHHAVCPKRPIEVGDYVRWEYGLLGYFAHPDNWAEGEVMGIDRVHADIRVERCGLGTRTGTVTAFGYGRDIGSTIRRILPAVSVDGLTPVQCLAAFENMQMTDGRTRKLTALQLAVARGLHTVALRAKVAAGPSPDAERWREEQRRQRAERERSRVVVDLEW